MPGKPLSAVRRRRRRWPRPAGSSRYDFRQAHQAIEGALQRQSVGAISVGSAPINVANVGARREDPFAAVDGDGSNGGVIGHCGDDDVEIGC
jgi:hypothetical protein